METTARTNQEWTTATIVAANLTSELASQRWSGRQAAFKLGLNPMYVLRRMNGDVECTASDLVAFAGLLGIPVTKLLQLPDLDSNQEPAGYKPAPETQPNEVIALSDRRHPTDRPTPAHPAIVSQIRTLGA